MERDPIKLEEMFWHCRQLASEQDRRAYLDSVCADKPTIRTEVEMLLRAIPKSERFLEPPPASAVKKVEPVAPAMGPGTRLGQYTLLEQIGEGGMGCVFRARKEDAAGPDVALKVIRPGMDSRQVVQRFEAERQALVRMDHPHVARVLDAGSTESGLPYFVMELALGIPVTEYCDQERLSTRARLELMASICMAVQHAHQKGVIHRDLKPTNVLVSTHDAQPLPKVIDFGIAKATQGQLTDDLLTGCAQILGTPLYMSPEQAAMHEMDVDTRSDVFSLGVMLYELLTGITPFDRAQIGGASFDEIRRIIREEEPPRPSTRLSTVSATQETVAERRGTDVHTLVQQVRGELDWIVMKALEKDRARRYESASALARDIQRYLRDEAVEACPPSAGYRFRKFAQRHKTRLVTAVTFAVVLLIATTFVVASIWERQQRMTRLRHEVEGHLVAARAFLHSGDCVNAAQEISEARGRLAMNPDSEELLAVELTELSREVADRIRAEERFHRFEDLRRYIHANLYDSSPGIPGHVRESCQLALDLYMVFDKHDWADAVDFHTVGAERQVALKTAICELLYIWARIEVTKLPPNTDAGAHRRAIDAWERIEAACGPIPGVYQWMSESWRTLGESELATQYAEQAESLSDSGAIGCFARGEFEYFRGRKKEALEQFSIALRREPNHYLSAMASGLTLLESGQYADAEAMLAAAAGMEFHAAPADPAGIVLGADEKLYVGGRASHNVLRFNPSTGAFIDIFVAAGSGGLFGVEGIAFGPDGNLYVSSHNNHRVLRYRGSNGSFIDEFVPSGRGGLAYPSGLQFGPDNNLYVSSVDTNNVLRFHGATGEFIDEFVEAGSGGLKRPEGLLFRDGNLYVASHETSSVLRYDAATGDFIDEFVVSGSGGLERTDSLAFSPDGTLYVNSQWTDEVFRCDGRTGAVLNVVVKKGNGGLNGPRYLVFGPNDQLFVGSRHTAEVLHYGGATGTFVKSIPPREKVAHGGYQDEAKE